VTESIDGKWCLIAETEDERKIPAHHVAFSFGAGEGNVQGALIDRVTSAEVPLPLAIFDGTNLQLRLPDQPTDFRLSLSRNGPKFEGCWMNATGAVGPKVKLVRRSLED